MHKQNTKLPMLSIVIPSYNQGNFLPECLDSILSQDYPDIEIIVVDGASTDSTLEVLKHYEAHHAIRFISEPDDGPADAVNKGLAQARGGIVGIQCADDFYLPNAFGRVMTEFSNSEEVGLVYGEVHSISPSGEFKGCSKRPPHNNDLCIALCICIPQCSAFFRRDIGLKLGGWNKDFFTCDWEFWLRMMFITQTRKLDQALSAWRIYQGQRTSNREKVLESFDRMLDTSADINIGNHKLRKARMAAKHLIRLSFGPSSRNVNKLGHLLAAALLFPRVWPWIPKKAKFIPGSRRWLKYTAHKH